MAVSRPADSVFIYGEVGEEEKYLVAIPASRVEELVSLNRALKSAQTWGELRRAIPASEYQWILEHTFDDYVARPRAKKSFKLEDLPSYFDGDYPPWPAKEMAAHLPKAIVRRFLVTEGTILNGLYGTIDPSREDAFLAAMAKLGSACRRDDVLIRGISGYFQELSARAVPRIADRGH